MRLLVFGKHGQVGHALQRHLPNAIFLGRDTVDLAQPEQIRAAIAQYRPDALINAAAYTAVDKAESEPALAEAINAIAPGIMAEAMAAHSGWVIHYSTDYVFAGSGDQPYCEEDATGPLGVYGASKWRGEEAMRAHNAPHLILRTSWVYGEHGHNFAKTMLRLAAERDELRVVADQFGAPTHADMIAAATAELLPKLAPAQAGTYHLVAGGETSWHGFAQHLIARAQAGGMALRCPAERVLPIATEQYPTPAKRPRNSRLSTQKLTQTFGVTLPAWQIHADRFIEASL